MAEVPRLSEMLTLIIPTHERHSYLSRVLEYYEDTEFSLIVVDSSKSKFFGELYNPKFKYIHCPDMNWPEKLLMATEIAETPYITMCADDDFVAKTAFIECLSFLEKNSEYQQVQGYMLGFRHYASRTDFELIYPHAYKFDVKDNCPISRLENFYKNYVQTFYVVRHKEGFKEALLAAKSWDISGKMIDQMISTHSLIKGKMKVLPVFFGAREYIANSSNQSWLSLEDLYQKHEYQPLMNRFFSVTADVLSKKAKISIDESELALRKIYGGWILYRKNKTKIYSLLTKSLIIRSLYKIIRLLHSLKIRKIYRTYGIVIERRSRELTLVDESQNRELQKMKQLINKHSIKSF